MDLVVFDLDGTLLNQQQRISEYTRDTLHRLGQRHIAYTIATGRTLHAARACLEGHDFRLPHVYKNGVLIWDPGMSEYRHPNFLTSEEINAVLRAFHDQGMTPFVCTLEDEDHSAIYHPRIMDPMGEHLLGELRRNHPDVPMHDLSALHDRSRITNISALGPQQAADAIGLRLLDMDHLVAYAGESIYNPGCAWMDIHHSAASKGSALEILKAELGFERIICFGDSDNDASMFSLADESYAPANATEEIKGLATAVIGHHDQDGIARFLRERFDLG
ncbi:MAG: Cof-type HAD-IIB family hydrolase [Natronospirillum sp.]|uniref:HAD family hydrolase n=1 Tax=Natronospirillum sp. TaxID=2812955 RepID=UPI0025EDB250|nr:HAD family hydrolase [Natronospirillum sp.]MCH8552134.1 Cof-type HAD-IIB family hydrolase [Natronospirillum sp.]